jgi:predicted SAM-dependent methyltransferase
MLRSAARNCLAYAAAARTRIALRRKYIDKLEVGAGAKGRNGWTTLDLHGADYIWDLRWRLPLREASVGQVYSSHVMEHFSYPDLIRLLCEIHRVLKPGGVYKAAVPNASLYVDAYVRRDLSALKMAFTPALRSPLPIDALNYVAYMDGHHRYLFDQENLQRVLAVAGFADIRLREFEAGLDAPSRHHESLYVEARKEAAHQRSASLQPLAVDTTRRRANFSNE